MTFIILLVRKGKARKHLKIATEVIKRKPKQITKYKVLTLSAYKTAATANKLAETKFVTKIDDVPKEKAKDFEMVCVDK